MSVRAVDHRERAGQVAFRIEAALHEAYPHITTEIVYDPPDGATAWVRVDGPYSPEEWSEITDSTLDLTAEALEHDGVLVLAI